jgi:rod shape-determining protein MreD
MLNDIIKLFVRFIVLVLLQIVVLNNVQLNGYINPYLYVLFILMLPVKIPRLLLLFIAFMTGFVIDIFSNTMGMHSGACVFMAFCRPGVLRLIAPREGYEAEAVPSVKEMSFNWFLLYAGVLILLHHLFLFYMEVFRFSELFSTLLRILFSSVATLSLVILSQFLFVKSQKER